MKKLPLTSTQLTSNLYSRFESVEILRDGIYSIEKSAEYNTLNGKQYKGSIIFSLYEDENLIDCFRTLAEAKNFLKKINS